MLKARVHFPMRAISDNGSSLAERNNQLIVNWSKALVPFTIHQPGSLANEW